MVLRHPRPSHHGLAERSVPADTTSTSPVPPVRGSTPGSCFAARPGCLLRRAHATRNPRGTTAGGRKQPGWRRGPAAVSRRLGDPRLGGQPACIEQDRRDPCHRPDRGIAVHTDHRPFGVRTAGDVAGTANRDGPALLAHGDVETAVVQDDGGAATLDPGTGDQVARGVRRTGGARHRQELARDGGRARRRPVSFHSSPRRRAGRWGRGRPGSGRARRRRSAGRLPAPAGRTTHRR